MRAIVLLPLAILAAPAARGACEAPPLFAMDGPTCGAASMTIECGCSECLEWGATDGAAWYEVTRCEVETGRCVQLGDTRLFAAMLGGWEIVLILAVVLILFGAKKLPSLRKAWEPASKNSRKPPAR